MTTPTPPSNSNPSIGNVVRETKALSTALRAYGDSLLVEHRRVMAEADKLDRVYDAVHGIPAAPAPPPQEDR